MLNLINQIDSGTSLCAKQIRRNEMMTAELNVKNKSNSKRDIYIVQEELEWWNYKRWLHSKYIYTIRI